jgi:3-oxoacyl-(acyl-carrier-protein) synthase
MFNNGAGIVVLKRLEDALEDGDQIIAVIKGVGLNNDGADKVSFTAPSVLGQAKAVMPRPRPTPRLSLTPFPTWKPMARPRRWAIPLKLKP